MTALNFTNYAGSDPFRSFEFDGWRCDYVAKTFSMERPLDTALRVWVKRGDDYKTFVIFLGFRELYTQERVRYTGDHEGAAYTVGYLNRMLEQDHLYNLVHTRIREKLQAEDGTG